MLFDWSKCESCDVYARASRQLPTARAAGLFQSRKRDVVAGGIASGLRHVAAQIGWRASRYAS